MQAYVNSRNRESAIWTLSRDVQVLLLVQLCSCCQFCRLFGHWWFWLFTHAKKIFLNRGQCTNPMKRRLAFNEWTAEKFAKSMIESIIWAKVCGNVQMKVSLLNILCKTCQISEIDHLLEVFAWISCVFYVFWANFNKVL